ncbi:glycosyl hydrolase family 95 catalytic domain-containing protein [Crossiella sp. CA198]|uniref:glycosyl hydrolase family 95 catalytic domain-containing protein n=1 Tax=Crossiella sp. CA198 TaxID=3455607 RepID=UPI003F8D819D
MDEGTAGISRRGFLGVAVAGSLAGSLAGPLAAESLAAESADGARAGLRDRMRSEQAWADFLGAQDLRWARMPRTWYEGPFLGNGFLATSVYREPGANALRFTVDHSQVQDHRPAFGNEWGVARLPVGRLLLTPVGTITGVDLRLDLWQAELRGTVTTDRGTLEIRAIVHSVRSLLRLTVRGSLGEKDFTLAFHPAEAISPRTIREEPPKNFTRNPPPELRTAGDLKIVVQPMVAGGQTATAYREAKGRNETTLLLSVAHTHPDATAEQFARTTVRRAALTGEGELLREHRNWWHDCYRRSFLSIPDGLLQSFYWIQLYKLASASRASGPVMATTGPWLEPTPWPSVWWNLNAQLQYWPVHGSGHPELDPIPRTLATHRQTLVDGLRPEYRHDSAGLRRSTDAQFDDAGFVGVPGQFSPDPEVGDLPWLLHNVWLSYRHSMDERLLREVLYPLLRKAMNYYLHFLAPAADGKLHLPPTFSPEYGSAPDCNYDLALIRWSCATLLESVRLLRIHDPLAARWQEVLDKLVDYPVDGNGFMIGAGAPFAKSHRHYSHLLMVYPLYLVNAEQPEHRDLIDRSLKHWISFEGALRGYSFTGAASISSQFGRGDDALKYLRELVARFLQPNTMYYEAGPVIETPLSGMQSLHDMLCQSWGGIIRIFPAVPGDWSEVTLHDFRTEGAFLVSAVRRKGKTDFVRIRSLAGEPCRVRTGIPGRLAVRDSHGRPHRYKQGADNTIEIELRRGEEVIVHAAGARPDLTIAPVKVSTPAPPWGLPPLPPGGDMVTVDLEPFYTNDGITNEFYLGDGDFDGTGRTYPSGALPQNGSLTNDGVPFRFTNGHEGTRNNIIGAGQTVELPEGNYRRLHVLGASDNGNTDSTVTLHYTDGTATPVKFALTDWLASAAFGESEALRTNQIHTRTGPVPLRAAVFHQVLAADSTRRLRAITLSANAKPRSHVFAVTLEKVTNPV